MTAIVVAILGTIFTIVSAFLFGRRSGSDASKSVAQKAALKTAGEIAQESEARAARDSDRARQERAEVDAAARARVEAPESPTTDDVAKAQAELAELRDQVSEETKK